eukprot:CAMPEP_0175844950 /NCGR_PEP_ID=MMETSP0107_2-20121207/21939_1 /TAXON_ID=195067 ORGANISM="Goniomonas pacifica, Strain CCMP1869" /NCGR_SAMPLE_ID=MMETSP0107_2 /ASSEMBLY_ACC=CAM_ASM_000203 /LENGTH=52 /DNA_ID=CAMNT_0017159425 /DNA_START=355 /DNA_END=513 /DNA_ORIENTATION=-
MDMVANGSSRAFFRSCFLRARSSSNSLERAAAACPGSGRGVPHLRQLSLRAN